MDESTNFVPIYMDCSFVISYAYSIFFLQPYIFENKHTFTNSLLFSTMADARDATKPHVAALASPGMGHLIPILEFVKHGVHVSFLVVTTESSAAQRR